MSTVKGEFYLNYISRQRPSFINVSYFTFSGYGNSCRKSSDKNQSLSVFKTAKSGHVLRLIKSKIDLVSNIPRFWYYGQAFYADV